MNMRHNKTKGALEGNYSLKEIINGKKKSISIKNKKSLFLKINDASSGHTGTVCLQNSLQGRGSEFWTEDLISKLASGRSTSFVPFFWLSRLRWCSASTSQWFLVA